MDRRPKYQDQGPVDLAQSSANPAARPPVHGSGVTAYNPRAPIAKANRPAPPLSRCTVHGQGLRVGVVGSFGGILFGKLSVGSLFRKHASTSVIIN